MCTGVRGRHCVHGDLRPGLWSLWAQHKLGQNSPPRVPDPVCHPQAPRPFSFPEALSGGHWAPLPGRLTPGCRERDPRGVKGFSVLLSQEASEPGVWWGTTVWAASCLQGPRSP